jgi:hypothetical protein
MFHYRLHGLCIASQLELPPLPARDDRHGDVGVDVTILFEPVEDLPSDAASRFRNWTAAPGHMVITALGSARFAITGGNRIAIDTFDGALADDLVSFTLGSAMSALLQQRELLPLHASSVVTDKGALLVTGRSGAGKSTLIAQLAAMGYPILADDVTAIAVDEAGVPLAQPGLPAMRLWKDALQRLGLEDQASRPVRAGLEKYYLPAASHIEQPQPICGIVRLSTKAEGPVETAGLESAAALSRISHHVHRKHFLAGMQLQRFAFERASALIRHAPMIEIKRPHIGFQPAEMAALVLEHFGLSLPVDAR